MEILKKFIVDNNLEFKPGNRNTPLVTLCGFALYKGLDLNDCIKSIDEIDEETEKELKRVFAYCDKHNYSKWWENVDAITQYKFE